MHVLRLDSILDGIILQDSRHGLLRPHLTVAAALLQECLMHPFLSNLGRIDISADTAESISAVMISKEARTLHLI